jgi:hypothetical protein
MCVRTKRVLAFPHGSSHLITGTARGGTASHRVFLLLVSFNELVFVVLGDACSKQMEQGQAKEGHR